MTSLLQQLITEAVELGGTTRLLPPLNTALVRGMDGISPSVLAMFGTAPYIGISGRNTAVFGTYVNGALGGYPAAVTGAAILDYASGYGCGVYGHTIALTSGNATNEMCVENKAGPPSTLLPPNRAAGTTERNSIVLTIAPLGNYPTHYDATIGLHIAKNGVKMRTGAYIDADGCTENGLMIDATATDSAKHPLTVKGSDTANEVAVFQSMGTPSDFSANTKWLDNVGGTVATVTRAGSFYSTATANAFARARIGAITGTPAAFQLHVTGSGQTTSAIANGGAAGGAVLIGSSNVVGGAGGALLIGAGTSGDGSFYAGVKGLLTNGVGYTTGDMAFSLRETSSSPALTEMWRMEAGTKSLLPGAHATNNIGSASNAIKEIFAASFISPSDERLKTNIREFTEAEKRAAVRIKASGVAYQMKDAVAKKGRSARWHYGYVVQTVIEILEDEGLEARRSAFICEDPVYAPVIKTRTITRPVMEDYEEPTTEIVMEGGMAIQRTVMRKGQREMTQTVPLLDEAGKPVMEQVFVRWENGKTPRAKKDDTKRIKENRVPIFEDMPKLHTFVVTEDVEEEYTEMQPTGETTLGLRYEELEVLLGSV